jgi:cobalamin biosynthetic protein CobC
MLGPWAVSGPAQQISVDALCDRTWQDNTRRQLNEEGIRLHTLLASHGIGAGGTALFQWWPEPRAEAFWQHMAERGIWVRLFREAARGIRLGLPPDESAWRRLEHALIEWKQTTV